MPVALTVKKIEGKPGKVYYPYVLMAPPYSDLINPFR